jgi:hypothetical protein
MHVGTTTAPTTNTCGLFLSVEEEVTAPCGCCAVALVSEEVSNRTDPTMIIGIVFLTEASKNEES